MADPWQLALLRRSLPEWNAWRYAHPEVRVDLSGALLSRADLTGAYLHRHLSGADLSGAYLSEANLSEANLSGALLNGTDLSGANLSGAHIYEAKLRGANLSRANLSRANLDRANLDWADLSGADLRAVDLRAVDLSRANLSGAKWDTPPPKSTTPTSHPSQPSTIDWLSLVETYGNTLLITVASFAAIIQGLDVIERRWREHKEKQHGTSTAQSSPSSSTQQTPTSSQKTPISDKDITDILLVMDDGSHHSFQRWVSNPDTLRAYIDAFSDPSSKVKPLEVVFRKRKGRALSVDVTEGEKDNRQLNVILSYLEADPQP